jgi:Rhamnan synthesis protein F/Glycosyltransferase WbsX
VETDPLDAFAETLRRLWRVLAGPVPAAVEERPTGPDVAAREVYLELLRRAQGAPGPDYVPTESDVAAPQTTAAKLVAIYRPPADWTAVARGVPQYVGHRQPRFPDALGYYDYRSGDVLRGQVELARRHGIHAFCFDADSPAGAHTPLARFLGDPTLELKFCVQVSTAPDQSRAALDAIRDDRYLCVGSRPLLVVDAGADASPRRAIVERWKEAARRAGHGDVLLAVVLGGEDDPRSLGADAAIEAPPLALADVVSASRKVRLANPGYAGSVLDYRTVADHARSRRPAEFALVRTVIPSWDSEPSEPGTGISFVNDTPARYRRWLAASIAYAKARPVAGEALVFVEGWNVWDEGAYLEPDRDRGYAYLQATRDALTNVEPVCETSPLAREAPVAVIVHAYYPELLPEMLALLASWRRPYELHVTAPPDRAEAIRTCLGRAGGRATLHSFENRGRDILPFLEVARPLAAAGERLFLKLHTKRSLHRVDGEVWRRDILGKLLAPEAAARITEAMLANARIGIVGPEGHVLSLYSFWGSNRVRVNELAYRMGLPPVEPADLAFVGGSMFWARTSALRPLLDLDLDAADFEPEAGQVDGTLAHAIERAFALSALRAGLRLTDSSDPTTVVAGGRRRYLHAEGQEAPSALPLDFDAAAYLRANPDVEASGQDPAQHFLRVGWAEGRRW